MLIRIGESRTGRTDGDEVWGRKGGGEEAFYGRPTHLTGADVVHAVEL